MPIELKFQIKAFKIVTQLQFLLVSITRDIKENLIYTFLCTHYDFKLEMSYQGPTFLVSDLMTSPSPPLGVKNVKIRVGKILKKSKILTNLLKMRVRQVRLTRLGGRALRLGRLGGRALRLGRLEAERRDQAGLGAERRS